MSAGIGVANLIIADKRSDGYIDTHSWGLDFPMAGFDRTRRIQGAYQNNPSLDIPEWIADGVVPLPELAAAILEPQWGASDMSLDDWYQESSTYWKLVQPPGDSLQWIKYYDGRADQSGSLISMDRPAQNGSWGFCFLRAAPPPDQADPVYLRITLNCLGTVQYRLCIRQDGLYYPTLEKSVDVGASWTVIDVLGADDAARWAAGAFGSLQWCSCLYLPDRLIFHLGDLRDPWIYYESDLVVPEGHVRVEIAGGHTAFHFDQITFPGSGTVERLIHITPPGFLSAEADTTMYGGQTPTGTAIATEMLTDGDGAVYPKATLSSDGTYSPVLYAIHVARPATHAAPVAGTIFDNTLVPHQGKLQEIEFTIAQGWRGSSFRAKLLTVGEYGITGNEKAQVRVALDTGAGISYLTQMTGYLETPKLARHGQRPGEVPLELRGRDLLCRLRNKDCKLLPAFGGWSFYNAWMWLFHEVAGLPESMISPDAGAADWILPYPPGQISMKYDQTLDIVTVADQLARAAGREWGVGVGGIVFTRPLGSVVYGGIPDFILDDETVTEADAAYLIDLDRDLFAVRNHVMCIGQDRSGNDVIASWRYTNTMTDPNNDPFIGDEWCEVRIAPEGADPYLIAMFTGSELIQYRALLRWQTEGKPTLFPDHFVYVDVAGIDVPVGSVFRIISKWGRISAEGEFVCEFLGAIQ